MRSHRNPRVLALFAGFLLLLAVPATGPAQSPGASALKQKGASLAAQSRATVLELYGLDSRLAQTRSELARLDAQAAALAGRQAVLRTQLRSAQQTAVIAQERLADQLRFLYEEGEPDPIAVILGATSLDDAIGELELLNRAARATDSVLEQSRTTRTALAHARAGLAAQARRTNAARAQVAATAAGLEQARTERASYLATLRQKQALTAAQLTSVEQQARAATAKAAQVTEQAQQQATGAAVPPPVTAPAEPPAAATAGTTTTAPTTTAPSTVTTAPAPAPTPAPPPPPHPGGTMTVLATAYCLRGTTATGLRVAPGIVATDPTVIPLGTRMSIPGYGIGVAADTGSAVKGAHIDVWIASCAKARDFTRTVTITFL